ncbi:MAG: ATP-dependent DNA helicase [Bacteroidetes bacterium]|nr:MAG: ATP-dependent DNA helicase [Bacteroidota bacterium]
MNTPHNYLDELNDIQRQAVTETEGPVLVVAGPGSGKTRVLTYRIAHLIQKGVAPWEILALTFTNKAAREMKARIEKVVGDRANRVWAGTFHSIFARILRVEAEKIGYPSNFTIYDSDDTKSVIGTIIKEMNLNKDHYNVNAVRSCISSAKSNLITPKLYANSPELMEQDRLAKRPWLHKIYAKYVAKCKRAGAMDFDDLLYRLFELLQGHEEVRKKYQERFRYVLVDEFQDTNYLQYSIVKKLVHYENSPRNICVVGDDAQSIYAFRGATIQNILDFEKDFKPHGIRIFKLEQNYRSTNHIVQAANEVIMHNRRQIQKTIWSDKGEGNRIQVVRAVTDNEEGKRVADMIVEQKNRHHLSNNQIAILYRTNAQSRIFEEYLRRYNIPYRIYGGLSFYQRKEVKDLIAYLRLVVNPKDEEALRRSINYPRRGIGNTTIEKISALAESQNKTMWEVMTQVSAGTRARNAIAGFKAMIEAFQEKARNANAYEVAVMVAKQSGLVDLLKKDTTIEGMGRLENVNALLDGIQEFVADKTVQIDDTTGGKSLADYLQNIALLTDFDDQNTGDDHITLMSVHSAKGLEFKSVFVVGMEENLFPSFMALKTDDPNALDEERRLFYVAITRAEEFLTLTYSKSRYRYGKEQSNEPSRFLNEINLTHLDSPSLFDLSGQSGGRFASSNQSQPARAGVSGNFRRPGTARAPRLRVDPKNFRPSPSEQIQNGMRVLHMKFGEGKVLAIDGANDKRVATIFFKDLPEEPQKRIMLKFAKLQILN